MTAKHYEARLRDLPHAGVYHQPRGATEELVRAAGANGFACFRVDLDGVADKDQLLATVAAAMEFPDWFGHNWDALLDCLTDLSWRPADGYLLLLERCDGIHGRAEEDFVTLMNVLAQAAVDWRDQGRPFWCFVDMQDDGIAWLPID